MSEAATEFLPILSAAAATGGSLVVSIHDVAPAMQTECEEMLHELKKAGVSTTSLLVIPDYHQTGRAMADAKFVDWLRAREEEGHEIVLHGYYHQRVRKQGENLRDRFITRLYTQDEGEFFDLDYAEAFDRITRGREEFLAAKFAPVGFIAPAWLLNDHGERAARDCDFEYTTRLTEVLDLRNGERQAARSLVYSTRTNWRRSASLAWNAMLVRAIEHRELVRLSLHPPDLGARPIWRQAMSLAQRLASVRQVTTYRDWIAERRTR